MSGREDEPVEGSLRYVAQRTALGDFGRHLYALAVYQGLAQAKQVVVLGDGAMGSRCFHYIFSFGRFCNTRNQNQNRSYPPPILQKNLPQFVLMVLGCFPVVMVVAMLVWVLVTAWVGVLVFLSVAR